MNTLVERIDDLISKSFTVGVDFPMVRAPSLEEAVEVGPSNGIELAPFSFDSLWVEIWSVN